MSKLVKVVILTLGLGAITMIGCGTTQNTATTSTKTTLEENKTQIENEDMLIVDNEEVKITYKGKEQDDFWDETKLKFEIVNKTDREITVQVRNFSIDDEMRDSDITFSADIMPGKKINHNITVSNQKVEDTKDVEGKFIAFDSETWDGNHDICSFNLK